MGKGDIRTRRGKVWRGTYGVTRPQKTKATVATSAKTGSEKKATKTAKKKKEEA